MLPVLSSGSFSQQIEHSSLFYDVKGEAKFGCNAIVALKCIGQKSSFIIVSQLKMNTGLLRIFFLLRTVPVQITYVTVTSELLKFVNNGLDDSESLLVLNLVTCELITVGSDNLMEEWLNRSRWLQAEI
ncbi:hypothetical protein NC652_033134 [Populus alba x Populus x berolinensis]|nr:hypothetical protein NC652_033134 [Populus alba x Populus x berolinensis]